MKHAVLRGLAFFGGGVLLLCSILVVLGVVVALVRDEALRESGRGARRRGSPGRACSSWGSGSTAINYHGSRDVVGSGSFVGARVPLPQMSLVWALVGFVLAGIGILVLLV